MGVKRVGEEVCEGVGCEGMCVRVSEKVLQVCM